MVRGLSMGRTLLPTRTRRGPLFPPPPSFTSSFSSLSYVHARALTRSLARLITEPSQAKPRNDQGDDAYARNCGGTTLFFFLASSASFFSHGRAIRAGKKRRDRTPGYDLAAARPCVRTYMRYYTAPKGERAPVVLGKTFSGTCENRLDRAPEYKIKLAVRWRAVCVSCITSSSVARLICIIPAHDSFSFSRLVSSHPTLDNCTRYLIFDTIVRLYLH